MTIPPLPWRRIILGTAIVFGLITSFHWGANRQVRLHQQHFLRAVEDRKWAAAGDFLAADYEDRWGQTKPKIMVRLPQVFADFLALGISSDGKTFSVERGAVIIREHIRIVGSGGPIAQYVMQESANLTEPFSFRWRHQSWKPWDWALVSVDQPQLDIPAGFGPEF